MRVKGNDAEPVTLGTGGSRVNSRLASFSPLLFPTKGLRSSILQGEDVAPNVFMQLERLKGFSTLPGVPPRGPVLWVPICHLDAHRPLLAPKGTSVHHQAERKTEGPTFSHFY